MGDFVVKKARDSSMASETTAVVLSAALSSGKLLLNLKYVLV